MREITQYAVLDRETREQLSEWLYCRKMAINILLTTQTRERRECMLAIRRVEIEEEEQ